MLMRHAKSSWDDSSLCDHDRPLNDRGRKAAAVMASRLKAEGYRPDLVLLSGATRTVQTAEALQNVYGDLLPLRTAPELYEAKADAYVQAIRQTDSSVNHLLLIAHNPTIERVVQHLSGRDYRMPTAAYVRFACPGAWEKFALSYCHVDAYDYPKSYR